MVLLGVKADGPWLLHSSAQYEQRFSFFPITQADYRLHDTADEPRSVSGIPPAQYQASATQ